MSETSVIVQDVLESLGIVLAFIVAGKGIIYVLDRVVRKLTERTATRLDDMVLAVIEKPAFHLIVLWGVYIAVHRLSINIAQGVLDIIDKAVFVIAVAFITKVVYDIINAFIDWYGIRAAENGQEGIGKSLLPLLKKLIKIFAVLSGLIVILDHFDYNITSLVAALGVSSLAIGLAAKETLSNMISGFIIMADRPFRVGDRIEVDGRVGEITEIGIRSTKMKTLENTIVILPNAKLVDNVVLNFAYPENSLNHYYKVGVEYGSDIDRVREVLLDVAAGIEDIAKDPPPGVFFIDHADSALEFQMVCRISDYRMRWAALDKVNTAVNKRFAAEGISIAFPTRTLYLINQETQGRRENLKTVGENT